jgi:hypothetical protein
LEFLTLPLNFFLFPSKIQNGGEIQDGRQTIKCSRFVRNNADNLQPVWRLVDFGSLDYLNNIIYEQLFALQNS